MRKYCLFFKWIYGTALNNMIAPLLCHSHGNAGKCSAAFPGSVWPWRHLPYSLFAALDYICRHK